jgi:hypothetical protein
MVAIDRRGDDPSKLDFSQNKKITPLPADIKKLKLGTQKNFKGATSIMQKPTLEDQGKKLKNFELENFKRGYVYFAKTHVR